MTNQEWDRTLKAIRGACQRYSHGGGLSYKRIARESGLDTSAVSRALKDGYATTRTREMLAQWWGKRGDGA